MILSTSVLPDIVPPGDTFWGWETILGAGFAGAFLVATVWILIPAVETPPNSKQEWTDMTFFWTVAFVTCLLPSLGLVGGANLTTSGMTHGAVETSIEEHYGGVSIDGDIPKDFNSESEFTVILNPEELEEASSFWDDEVEEQSLKCRMETNGEGYLPIECLNPDTEEYEPLEPRVEEVAKENQ